MITIKNTQRSLAINEFAFKKDIQTLLTVLGYEGYDITVWLTTNATIRKYNRTYRHKDKPTDILSFPFYPDLKAGERIVPHSEEEQILGDIIISLEYVKKDALRWNQTFEKRMKVLLVHGICHLLGYDHITDEDYEVMQKKEIELLKKIS